MSKIVTTPAMREFNNIYMGFMRYYSVFKDAVKENNVVKPHTAIETSTALVKLEAVRGCMRDFAYTLHTIQNPPQEDLGLGSAQELIDEGYM